MEFASGWMLKEIGEEISATGNNVYKFINET